jgi:hypothetical protein
MRGSRSAAAHRGDLLFRETIRWLPLIRSRPTLQPRTPCRDGIIPGRWPHEAPAFAALREQKRAKIISSDPRFGCWFRPTGPVILLSPRTTGHGQGLA